MSNRSQIQLLKAIQRLHHEFMDDADPRVVFDNLLSCLLEFTSSEYGFIGDVQTTESGDPYLRTQAITNVAWNEETRRFYDENAPSGLEFHNMNTLFGAVITSKEPVIANRPQEHPRSGGVPEGHPPLVAFLGLPLFGRDELIGAVGLANRAEGYDRELIDYIGPLLATCSSVLRAHAAARQKRSAESALRDSEQRYRRLVEDQPEPLCRFRAGGTFSFVNQACANCLGRTLAECEHLNFFDLIPDSDRTAVQDLLGHLGSELPIDRFELQMPGADGEIRWMQWTARALFNDDGDVIEYQAVGLDVTDRRRAEAKRRDFDEQLAQVQKLESLGVLAGGIAHDFNNLLTAIVGNVNLAQIQVPQDSPLRRNLDQIDVASQRAAELCQQMLAYSGHGRFRTEVVDLSSLVREMVQMLQSSISKKAALDLELDDHANCRVDVTQIRQVVMNLITNASDALGDQAGVIRIRTGTMDCEREYLQDSYLNDCLPKGAYGFLEVSDSGHGMDRATIERMCDPFFTTKFSGRGLGMAAALGIVRGHRGAIRIASEVGVGTKILFLLPTSTEAPSEHSAPEFGAVAGESGIGTVLVVDDEECVRSLAQESLLQYGYEVLLAVDGEDALRVFREHVDVVDVVVLDLTMPRLSGSEVLRELRAIRSDMPVVLSSGYGAEDVAERFTGLDRLEFLHKPYRPSELAGAVEEGLRTKRR